MKNIYPYLQDTNFLNELINLTVTTYYVKITLLNWLENPIQSFEGSVINASINIDGKSAVRRTANITLTTDDSEIYQKISINKKVKIEIGYVNELNQYTNYPILWFPLGIYVIASCSSSFSNSGLTLALQLKDKMCLLNGEFGGVLQSSVVFDTYETIDQNGQKYISRPTIYQIIQQLVNHFGNEQLGKIIISDLDSRVKQVMRWTGSNPLYFLSKTTNQGTQYYMTINGSEAIAKTSSQGFTNIAGSPFGYGSDIGFIYTDFSYPGDLIGDIGNTITDILDKIKNTLGNYEYFYDLDGNFVFQEIKNYLNNSQSKYIIDSLNYRIIHGEMPPDYISEQYSPQEAYLINISKGKSVFRFDNSDLITSYSNNPQFNMIKNDFVIWGLRKTVQGGKIPIRYHLAIDTKPKPGNTYTAFEYKDPQDGIMKWHMPLQFSSYSNFPTTGAAGVYYMDTSTNRIYRWGPVNFEYRYIQLNVYLENITTTDWRTELYFQGVTAEPYGLDSNFYYAELLNEWPQIYDIRQRRFKDQVIKNPSSINYYLDFLDTEGTISEFKIDNIGRRAFVKNEGDNVNCVFEPYIPDIVLINIHNSNNSTTDIHKLQAECQARNQQYYQVSDTIYDNLSPGGTFNSGYDYIRQLLHQYTSFNENISIQTVPIYFLEPNTRITVNNPESNIYGDYMIDSLSFALDTSSILTISAKRALEKI